jgi:hypothetical protein
MIQAEPQTQWADAWPVFQIEWVQSAWRIRKTSDLDSLCASGFVVATTALHIFDVVPGSWAMQTPRRVWGLRISGGAIACAGVWFAFLTIHFPCSQVS